MKAKTIKEELIIKAREMGIPLIGFAPVGRWSNPPKKIQDKFNEWIPEEFWPQSIYPEVKTVIVIGLPVQLPIVETAPSIYYHELYTIVNNLLDSKAYELSNYLTENGYPSIYLPRDGYGNIDILIKNPLAFFSHKHAAYLAGLGSFGENNVLLTNEYGPRIRFTSIFTTATIEGDPISADDLCTHCERCINQCPVNAIPEHIESDSSMKSYRPIDKVACATRSQNLREDYKSPCGICIKVCPVGTDRKIFHREDMSVYTVNNKYKNAWDHVKKYGSR